MPDQPILTVKQMAEVMDTSVQLIRRGPLLASGERGGLECLKGARKVSGRWQIPASTCHRMLDDLDPSMHEAAAGRWFWIFITFGFPPLPDQDWIDRKHKLIDELAASNET